MLFLIYAASKTEEAKLLRSSGDKVHNTGKVLSGNNNAKSGYPWKKVTIYPRLKTVAVWGR